MTQDIHRTDPSPGLVVLSIRRPGKLNALSCESADELRAALKQAEAEASIRAVVIRGKGKAFSTGLDLAGLDPDAQIDLGPILQYHFEPLVTTIRNLEIPVIAAINGPAAGVSVGVALSCDLCIASEAAYFLLPFANLGLVPDGGLTWLLPNLVGAQHAAAAAMLGEQIGARHAAACGLVWKSVPADQFEAEVERCGQRISSIPRQALVASKRALRASKTQSFEEQLLMERELQQQLGRTPEFRRSLSRFLKK